MNSEKQEQAGKPKAGDSYDIPVEGSLGLLALGARGLDLWRKKRAAVIREKAKKQDGGDEQKN